MKARRSTTPATDLIAPSGETTNVNTVSHALSRRGRLAGVRCSFFAAAAVVAASFWMAPSALAAPSAHPFEIEPGSFHITATTERAIPGPAPNSPPEGWENVPTDQAGEHENLTTEFNFEHAEAKEEAEETYNEPKTTIVNLPPGFIGSNTAVPTCPDQELADEFVYEKGVLPCPPDTQVGTISLQLGLGRGEEAHVKTPVFNMQTNTGVTSTLGFNVENLIVQVVTISLRPSDHGLSVESPSIEDIGELNHIKLTVWGLPESPNHTLERGEAKSIVFTPEGEKELLVNRPGGQEVQVPIEPYLAMPTECTGEPLQATMESSSWEEPEHYSEETTEIPPLAGCERDPFYPSLELQPTTKAAYTSTGLNASLLIPQTWEDADTLATAHLREAVVTLPEGFALNPSSGAGLGYCTEHQFEEETPFDLPGEGIGCPSESKVGTVEIETPVLNEKARGSVYVAQPFHNPYHNLLTLYVVAKVPARGIIVATAGKVEANPVSGQLTTTFDNLPEVPFNKFTLSFNQGATAPLSSPEACGTFTGEALLTPYSEPGNPRRTLNSFEMTEGVHNGPCPSGGIPPFHPDLNAGSINDEAGRYSPFYVRLIREDGEQEITHFSIKLPPGVVGKLAGIPLCTEAEIAQAKSREHEGGAAEEEADPSCPANSEVGHTYIEAGVGSVLARTPGKIYLAGPYHGSATSVVSITNARVGPFDLGTVVVREALRINPETGEVFVDSTGSDPVPHIVDGIPTRLRDVRIYMDRPEFVLNPTSCKSTSTASTLLGSGASFLKEIGIVPFTVATRFQVAGCGGLSYGPNSRSASRARPSAAAIPPSKRRSPPIPAKPTPATLRSPCRARSSSNRHISARSAPGWSSTKAPSRANAAPPPRSTASPGR